jgi:DNA-binding transcriptional LysR family regulator
MDGERPVVVAPSGAMDADDGDVLTDWALAGEGIALKPLFEVASHLRSGALVRVLPQHPPRQVSLALLYPHRPPLPAKARAFADLLVEEARSHITARMADVPP